MVLVPEAGDDVQMMKSGLMEIATIFVVNKSDRPDAEAFVNHLTQMMREGLSENEMVPVIKTVATQQMGIKELVQAIADQQKNSISAKRKKQLLITKLYQLIAAHQMRKLDHQSIELQLETEMQQKHFNIFEFAKQFL